MPVLSCQKNNKKGFKWGKQGVCFTESKDGKSPKERAAAVGRAIAAQTNKTIGSDVQGGFLVPLAQEEVDLLQLSPATLMGLNANELEDFHDRLHRIFARIGNKKTVTTDKGEVSREDVLNAHRILEAVIAERKLQGIIAQKDPMLEKKKEKKAIIVFGEVALSELEKEEGKSLLSAYFLHLKNNGFDIPLELPAKEVIAEEEGSKLYRLTDGYGEWYFKGNEEGYVWVAQKMPDVSAYSVNQSLAETGFDQKIDDLGWGDKAWDKALAEWFTANKSEGKKMSVEKVNADLIKFISNLDKQAEGIQFVIGRLKGETTTTVQSVLFDKEKWTVKRAKAWLKENEFKSGDLDESEDKLRFRQRNPGDFQDRSFRTIDAGEQKVKKGGFPINLRGWTVGETFDVVKERGDKLSQDEANYVEPSENSSLVCGDCRFFLRDESGAIGTCQVVKGPVAWFGTSDLYIDAGDEAAATFAAQAAQEVQRAQKDGGTVERFVPIIKTDNPGFIMAPVLVPEEPDFEGDVISEEEIEAAAHTFMEHFQNVGLMHQQILQSKDVVLVESAILRSNANINGTKLKKGTWIAAFRIHNPKIKELVQEGKITGVSIGGIGTRVEEK